MGIMLGPVDGTRSYIIITPPEGATVSIENGSIVLTASNETLASLGMMLVDSFGGEDPNA